MAEKTSEIATAARLEEFFGGIGTHLKDTRKRESSRSGSWATASARAPSRSPRGPARTRKSVDNVHQQAHVFPEPKRLGRPRCSAGGRPLCRSRPSKQREPITTWIVDDTGFLKQGKHSVGVQRQYTGSAGKITNCQIGVSLAVASSTEHLPLDFELYLPECWADDRSAASKRASPTTLPSRPRSTLALDMIERARRAGIPGDIVLADAAYGDSSQFRNGVRCLGFDFAVGVQSTLRVVRLDSRDRINEKPESVESSSRRSVEKPSENSPGATAPAGKLSSRFCFVRVKTTHDDGIALSEREPLWLVAEWLDGEEKPTKFLLTTLARDE